MLGFTGLPISALTPLMNLTIFLISSCANIIASRICSSGTSLAPASTIKTASSVPETVRWRSLFSLSSWLGLIINLPSTSPTKTEPVGPRKGMSEMERAKEEPSIASGSGLTSGSMESAVATTTTSL